MEIEGLNPSPSFKMVSIFHKAKEPITDEQQITHIKNTQANLSRRKNIWMKYWGTEAAQWRLLSKIRHNVEVGIKVSIY